MNVHLAPTPSRPTGSPPPIGMNRASPAPVSASASPPSLPQRSASASPSVGTGRATGENGERLLAHGDVGGYPHEWFLAPNVSDVTCIICTEVSRDAVESRRCGHIFCSTCVCEALLHDARCPTCREQLEEADIQTSLFVRRQISNLKVKCQQAPQGCQWTGTLNQLESHLKSCAFYPVKCNLCSVKVPRGEKTKHDQEVCPQRFMRDDTIVGCPNRCDPQLTMMRKHLATHLDSCPLQLAPCPYSIYGCSFKALRKDLALHSESVENSLMHLRMADTKYRQMVNDLEKKEHNREILEMETKRRDHHDLIATIRAESFIDIMDSMNQWLPAQVRKRQGNMIFVHYIGWDSRWDEWVDLMNGERVAKYKTHTGGPISALFKVGEWVEVYAKLNAHSAPHWIAGTVQQVVGRRVCVSLECYPVHLAHWIQDNDPKIIHLGQARPDFTGNASSSGVVVRPMGSPSGQSTQQGSAASSASVSVAPNSNETSLRRLQPQQPPVFNLSSDGSRAVVEGYRISIGGAGFDPPAFTATASTTNALAVAPSPTILHSLQRSATAPHLPVTLPAASPEGQQHAAASP